jgi:phosphatidylglycerol:prolipoprotein diacylglycerol transferase
MYGIIISLAIGIALYLGEKIAKDNNLDTNIYWGASLRALIGGVVGARLYHVIDYAQYYLAHPIRVFYLHLGGLGIYGAIFGGAIGLYLYLRGKNEPLLKYLNLAAIVIPLAQAVGRLANWTNMELYGKPTDLPWGLYVPPQFRTDTYRYNDVFHPLFVYESLLDILLFFVLWLLYQRKSLLQKMFFAGKKDFSMKGFFTLTYLIGYGVIRFSLEFLRIKPWQIYGINVAQAISLCFIFIGLLGVYKIIKPELPLPSK